MKRLRDIASAFGLAALLGVGAPSHAADLALGQPVHSGGHVYVDVSIAAGDNESIAGLQFDVAFDANEYALSEVVLGGVADAAGKDAIFTDAFPGATRVLVMGMNQNEIADGVVATLVLEAIGESGGGEVALERPILSDPFGHPLYVDSAKETAALDAEEISADTDDENFNDIATSAVETAEVNAGFESTDVADGESEQSDRGVTAAAGPGGRSRGNGLGFDRDDAETQQANALQGQSRHASSTSRRSAPRIDREPHTDASSPRDGNAAQPGYRPALPTTRTTQSVERFQIARVENPRNGEEKSSHDAAMMIAAPQNMVPRFESGGDYSIKNENASASGRPVLPWLAFLATFLLAMSSRVLVFGSRFTRAMGGRR